MLVEIKGVQFVNKGAELMLYAVLEQLQASSSDFQIVLEPGVNSPYKKRAALGALQKFAIRKGRWDLNGLSYLIPTKLRRWLRNSFGIVTEADVDVVFDASGFAYGDQWPSIKTKQLSKQILRMAKNGHKYVLLPQALGPFKRKEDQQWLKQALPEATLVCAREADSLAHVTELTGEASNVFKFADFTNLVNPIVDEKWQNVGNMLLIIPNYNMVSKRNANQQWVDRYIDIMVSAMRAGKASGLQPVILNHEGAEDAQVCEQIKRAYGEDVEIYQEEDPRKVKGIISKAELVICSRFHGCVSALCQGIPVLGTSWSHKYERLFEEYGVSHSLLTPDISEDALLSKMETARSTDVKTTASARESFKSESQEMWKTVFSRCQ